MISCDSEAIKLGQYVIIQRQEYTKLHKFSNPTTCATLGKDVIELANIENCQYFSTFKMIPKGKGKNRTCYLEKTETCMSLKDNLNISESGKDNRNIVDDGSSQKLSKDEIISLRDSASSSSDIVGTLISNSNTFHSKTEYSQEKYLKKKEKKYFEYIQIRKPTIRLIADVMYRQDPTKVLGIRADTLSQILTYSNINGSGNHLLYDAGSSGVLSAAVLNAIGSNTEGQLIHAHPGNFCQKQALLAMNFPEEQLNRCISVNLYSVLRQFYQKNNPNDKEVNTNVETVDEETDASKRKRKLSNSEDGSNDVKMLKTSHSLQEKNEDRIGNIQSPEVLKESDINDKKNGNDCDKRDSGDKIDKVNESGDSLEKRRPKWELENESACILLCNKVDSLVIIAKEHPISIFQSLLPFVKVSRPFVIYGMYQEPLQECYITMRKMYNVVGLRLISNWMRGYQVLPDRTHPDVLMQGNSGFILTGYIVQSS